MAENKESLKHKAEGHAHEAVGEAKEDDERK